MVGEETSVVGVQVAPVQRYTWYPVTPEVACAATLGSVDGDQVSATWVALFATALRFVGMVGGVVSVAVPTVTVTLLVTLFPAAFLQISV